MKKNKLVGIIIFIVGLLVIAIGVILNITTKKDQEVFLGADSGLSGEEFYNWETQLNIKAAEIVQETFNDKYPLDADGKLTLTLAELETKYQQDLSEFNTDTIKCDLENSRVTVRQEPEGNSIEVVLQCTNTAE